MSEREYNIRVIYLISFVLALGLAIWIGGS